ncbi:uncharacterized protein LOC143338478 [Chaetodon auriga]|uniref:uncharacterized protein LOC143338478 n=1 Tax=Chaetodon auriga TaxID=39042 RepID=UPI004032E18B
MVRLPNRFTQNLRCVGQLNGELLYELPQVFPPPAFAAAPPNTSNSNGSLCRRRSRPNTMSRPRENDTPGNTRSGPVGKTTAKRGNETGERHPGHVSRRLLALREV